MAEQLTACISGSFKFKPEIDELHEQFADLGVKVLEPTIGWLYIASRLPDRHEEWRPLPNERGLGIVEIEERFLQALKQSDFLYVNNVGSYFGNSSALEMGCAEGWSKPVFVRHPLTLENFEFELDTHAYWSKVLQLATPERAVRAVRYLKEMNLLVDPDLKRNLYRQRRWQRQVRALVDASRTD